MSVHVLGAGAMGLIVASEYAIGKMAVPTLILRTRDALNRYTEAGSSITITRPLEPNPITSTVSVPAIIGRDISQSRELPIKNLVVSTKTYSTEGAIKPLVPYMTAETNVIFLQNGMGVVPLVKEHFWPDIEKRPRFFHALSTHGAYKTLFKSTHHVGFGSLTISEIPDNETSRIRTKSVDSRDSPISGESLPLAIKALLQSDSLNASYVGYPQFLLKQLEKLVVNACINPLSALLDCKNGDLLLGNRVTSLFRRVIAESTDCFQKEFKEVYELPEAGTALSRDRLLMTVLEICKLTAENSSSMREDVRNLARTEIDSINGYIVKLGEKQGIPTGTNRILISLIEEKMAIERAKENLLFQEPWKE